MEDLSDPLPSSEPSKQEAIIPQNSDPLGQDACLRHA